MHSIFEAIEKWPHFKHQSSAEHETDMVQKSRRLHDGEIRNEHVRFGDVGRTSSFQYRRECFVATHRFVRILNTANFVCGFLRDDLFQPSGLLR